MTNTKLKPFSIVAFFLLVVITSLVYILYDFLNADVEGITTLYGVCQFIVAISLISVSMFILDQKRNKMFLSLSFNLLFAMLLFIQIAPAICWFWFNGQIVNDKPYDGVTGNWILGAYHLFIMIWGFFVIAKIHQMNKSTA